MSLCLNKATNGHINVSSCVAIVWVNVDKEREMDKLLIK